MTRGRGELIADLTHFLDERGRIAPYSGPARRLAEHLAAIIVMTTSDFVTPPDGAPGSVRCRRRPLHKPCTGYIDSDIGVAEVESEDEILWWCKQCGDHGSLRGWQNSFWDMTGAPSECRDLNKARVD